VNTLEAAAVAFGIVSVLLSARENIWGWPTAIVNVLLYAVVFHGARLYADMGLQVVYAGINAYGWYQWLRGGREHAGLKVTRAPSRLLVRLALFAVGGGALLGGILHAATDASLPWLDAALSTTSLAAQFLLARKHLENWLVWIAVDIVYVPMFLSRELYLTAGLYLVFLGLSVHGYRRWRRALT
jgi:nicotinamide mononucleotide transporter